VRYLKKKKNPNTLNNVIKECTNNVLVDAIGMMRIIAEQTLEIDEELCVCFIDWQKAFDCVNWTKLMQILKRTGVDWRDRIVCGSEG